MYKRKTKDEYVLQGNYGYGYGFEDECSYDTRKEAIQGIREYRENVTGVPYRIVKRRVKIEETVA